MKKSAPRFSIRRAFRKWIRVAALFALAAPVLAAPAPAADAPLPAEWIRLVATFDRELEKHGVVGASIGLVEDGRMVDRHDYGYADRARGRKVDGDTIFHWASITKTLNAITVMQMKDRGKLILTDPITRYVPELRRVHNPFGAMETVNIGQLLSHTAGFQAPTWPYRSGAEWEPFEPTDWEQVVAMMPYQRLQSSPGSKFGYSNPSWIYLARMVEQMSGDPWEYYVHKHVLSPLGMQRSYFGYTPPYLLQDRSQRYIVEKDEAGKIVVRERSGEFDPGITIPNGGWNSPLEDAAAYIGFLTNAARGDPERQRRYDSVLSRATLETMWRPVVAVSDAPDADRMGLAFFIIGEGERTVVGHTGSQGGFASFLYFNPKTGRGVVAGFNTINVTGGDGRGGYFSTLRRAAIELLQ